MRRAVLLAGAGALLIPLCGQQAQTGSPTEISQHDEPATFQARVNLVMVPVVVRDAEGRAVGNLAKADFRLFDKGKPQEISRFTVEKPGAPSTTSEPDAGTAEAPGRLPAENLPDRYVGYLFDDVHTDTSDLMRVREAAEQHMREDLRPSDRAAIFTTSGQVEADFTDDLGKLHQTLQRLIPRPISRPIGRQCPDISLYEADMIVNKQDPAALSAATAEVIGCMVLDPARDQPRAQQMAQNAARQMLTAGEHESRVSISVLLDAVMRMASMPGQRNLVLVSPGFYTLVEDRDDETKLMDRAIRANVIINSLNARGLYTLGTDLGRQASDPLSGVTNARMERESAVADEELLTELAAGTGGRYFHNSNDLHEGFRQLSTLPEFYYLMGFQPQNLKLDGSFHAIKVTLASKSGYSLQARHGYYAPRRLEDAAEVARRELQEAVFSREEMHDIPLELHTQFTRTGEDKATLAVLAHLDVKRLHFKKAGDRNEDRLTMVSALFDRNGKYVTGLTKTITFHLKDETLESRLERGITVRCSLDIRPGTYMVRLVVRDEGGQLMSATNGAVDIP